MKRRLPSHIIGRRRAHLRTVHQEADVFRGCITSSEFHAMADHLNAEGMAVLAELNAARHVLGHVVFVHGDRLP